MIWKEDSIENLSKELKEYFKFVEENMMIKLHWNMISDRNPQEKMEAKINTWRWGLGNEWTGIWFQKLLMRNL